MESDSKKEQGLSQNNHYLSTFFEHDKDFVFLIKKTEKLVSAMYLVSNFFSDNDPIKWKLRGLSSDLLSFIIGYKNIPSSVSSQFIDEAKFKVFNIVSLLEISFYGGLISQMNFSIIKGEFLNLLEQLNLRRNSEVSTAGIEKSFFEVKGEEFLPKAPVKTEGLNTGELTSHQVEQSYIKDKNLRGAEHDLKRSGRQNTILTLIKKKKEVTIKDISVVIRNCSEKTIQRELIGFMNLGIVKRIGERRWSKYSLV